MVARKLRSNRGFSLVELVAVVAIIGVLSTLAVTGVLSGKVRLDDRELDQNAETIAVAAQARMTEMRNTDTLDVIASLGIADPGTPDERWIASGTADMAHILVGMSLESELSSKDFVIGYQTSGKVFEVFLFENGFPDGVDFSDPSAASATLAYLSTDVRDKNVSGVGYYSQPKDLDADLEIAGAQLPTPQLSIVNFDLLTLDIYLPIVRQLPVGKKFGFSIKLADKDGKALSSLSDDDVTVYTTRTNNVTIETGKTYSFVLDTPETSETLKGIRDIDTVLLDGVVPTGRFADWAMLTKAFRGAGVGALSDGFRLGDDVRIVVDVYALKPVDGIYVYDATYGSRSAYIEFNSWFDSLGERNGITVANLSCGRHLQRLSDLTEIRSNLRYLLPTSTWDEAAGQYKDYTWGAGNAYSFVQSSESRYEKYVWCANVNSSIGGANQLMPIDFANDFWKDSSNEDILFRPINTVSGFYFYGNYYPIRNLTVHTDLYAGLFGYSYRNRIYDVRLVNPSIRSDMPLEVSHYYEMGVGGLIGTDRASSEINNCQIYLEKKSGAYDASRRVCGNGYIGGLIGFCEDEDLRQCSASVYVGNIDETKPSPYVGGLIGGVTGDCEIKRCYAAGILRGQYVGGIVGSYIPDTDYSGDDLEIESCYAAGNIEYASKGAAGLIGNADNEQRGYEKSAIRARKNYAVVIYGIGNAAGTNYVWSGGPIYGTFEGDNFVWVYADSELIASASEATDFHRLLVGAYYDDENFNYYVPQKGITYSRSTLWDRSEFGGALETQLQAFVERSKTSDPSVADIESLRDSVVSHKFLQVLEEVRAELISLKNDVRPFADPYMPGQDIEIHFDFAGQPQGPNPNDDGKLQVQSHSPKANDVRRNTEFTQVIKTLIGDTDAPAENTALWYLDQLETLLVEDGATVTVRGVKYSRDGLASSPDTTDFRALLTKFAVNFFTGSKDHSEMYWPFSATEQCRGAIAMALYDVSRFFTSEELAELSTFYNSSAQMRDTYTVRIEDGVANLYDISEKDKGRLIFAHFSFDREKHLLDENGQVVEGHTYDSIFGTSRKLHSGYTIEDGKLLYNGDVLSNRFCFGADYYLRDANGDIIMLTEGSDEYYDVRRYVERVQDNIMEMLYSLWHYGADWQGEYQSGLLDSLWKSGNNDGYVRQLIKNAEDYRDDWNGKTLTYRTSSVTGAQIDALFNKIFGGDYGEDRAHRAEKLNAGMIGDVLNALTSTSQYGAYGRTKAFNDLFSALDTLYGYFDVAKDYYQYEKPDKSKETHLRAMRDPTKSLRDAIELYSKLSYTGGIEDSLDNLLGAAQMKRDGKIDTAEWNAAKELYVGLIERAYLYDSGIPLYLDATTPLQKLKDVTMDTTENGSDGTFDHSDWYGYTSWSKYKYNFNEGMVLTVFPYHEKGSDTAVYPFPMIVGLKPVGSSSQVTPMLYHYGDWLTPDLWAYAPDPTVSALSEASVELNIMHDYLTEVDNNPDTNGKFKTQLDAVVTALDTCIRNVDRALASADDARTQGLRQARADIGDWLAAGGIIEQLETACKSVSGSKATVAQEIVAKMAEYRVTLGDLLLQIDAALA